MLRTGKWLISISLASLVVLLLLPSAPAQTSSRRKGHHKSRKESKQQVVLPPAPRGPLPQVPLEQLPAAPPQVNYQDGRLSILAQNSTLGDILREVRKRTGASIEVPPSATERVVASLGPAPPRDVLAALLNGSSFNYVMVGSAADPAALSSVMLTSKPAAGGAQTVAAVSQPAPVYTPPDRTALGPGMVRPGFVPGMQPVTPQPNPQVANADDSADDSQDADDSDQDEAQGQDQSGTAPPNAGPKTPDEILMMLQRQREQQQGQPPPPPNPQN